MTAKHIFESLSSGVIPEPGLLRQLAREAAHDRDLTAELFRDLVEPLSDSFDPTASRYYVDIFTEMIAELVPEFAAQTLRDRYGTISQPRSVHTKPSTVFVLSRVTLGADIAVTSVLMDAAKRAYPNSAIVFVGNRKNAELWAADPRITFQEAPYDRTGTLQGRINAHRGLVTLLDRPASLVLDPDSRLTQLGLIPICPDNTYHFFNSRTYRAATDSSLGTLAGQWATETLRVTGARAYIAPTPMDAAPRVTVSFGVGENPAKRVGEAFEISALQHLVRLGARVLVDQGVGGEEVERVKQAVRQTAGLPGQVEMFNGPFATFAAHIARSPLYLGYDSAGQHAAAALGIPSITVFAGYPNQRFLDRWKPTSPASHVYLADAPNLMNEIFRAMAQYLATA